VQLDLDDGGLGPAQQLDGAGRAGLPGGAELGLAGAQPGDLPAGWAARLAVAGVEGQGPLAAGVAVDAGPPAAGAGGRRLELAGGGLGGRAGAGVVQRDAGLAVVPIASVDPGDGLAAVRGARILQLPQGGG
jgi:hypothetical protein